MSVVVGVDASSHSAVVLGEAILEAQRRSTDLHVVHVFNPPVVYLEVPIDIVRVADAEKAAVWSELDPLISGAGVDVTKVDLDGYPPDMLVSYATDIAASLLVVGTRGRGEFASLILGSTSARAIHLARCDVLVVKPKEE
jgi:nucleotide-binding universal stress UspA family protein